MRDGFEQGIVCICMKFAKDNLKELQQEKSYLLFSIFLTMDCHFSFLLLYFILLGFFSCGPDRHSLKMISFNNLLSQVEFFKMSRTKTQITPLVSGFLLVLYLPRMRCINCLN